MKIIEVVHAFLLALSGGILSSEEVQVTILLPSRFGDIICCSLE